MQKEYTFYGFYGIEVGEEKINEFVDYCRHNFQHPFEIYGPTQHPFEDEFWFVFFVKIDPRDKLVLKLVYEDACMGNFPFPDEIQEGALTEIVPA